MKKSLVITIMVSIISLFSNAFTDSAELKNTYSKRTAAGRAGVFNCLSIPSNKLEECAQSEINNTKSDNSPIPLEWEGEFPWYSSWTGEHDFNGKENVHIHKFSKNEINIRGTIDIKFYDLDGSFYSSGTCAFQGTYDDQTRSIYIEATNWTRDPATDERHFNLFSLETTISEDFEEMEIGYYAKEVKFDSGFKLTRDNNSFSHANEFQHKYGDNYIISREYFDKLVQKAGKMHRFALQKLIEVKIALAAGDHWGGSCFGISSTMNLVFEEILRASDISSNGASSYYRMEKPCKDNKLRDVINYYQLLQNFIDEKNSGPSPDFFEKLVKAARNAARNEETLILTYNYRANGKNKGHAILVTGYEFNKEDKVYKLKLYNCNNITDESKYLIIKKDFSGYNLYNMNSITRISYFSSSDLKPGLHINSKDLISASSADLNYTYICFSSDSYFQATTSSGYIFNHDKSGMSGSLPVDSYKVVGDQDNCNFMIRIKEEDQFHVSVNSDKIDFTVYNGNGFKAVTGNKIKSFDLSVSGDMKLYGKAFTFKAFSTVDQIVDDNAKGLGSIYAKGKDEVDIHKGENTVEASSDKPMSNIETKIYQGVDIVSSKIKGKHKSVVVKTTEDTATHNLEYDGMIIFSKVGYAYKRRPIKPFVSVYVGGKSLKKNTDYMVKYDNNIEIGTGTITITGKGEYTGELSAEFSIVPKKVKVKSVASCESGFQVKWNSNGPKDGFEIQYSTDPDFESVKTKIVEDAKSASANVEGLVVGTEYFVRIRAYKEVSGKKYNSSWSEVKSVLVYPY